MAKTIREFKRGLPAGGWLPAHGDWMCGEGNLVCGRWPMEEKSWCTKSQWVKKLTLKFFAHLR